MDRLKELRIDRNERPKPSGRGPLIAVGIVVLLALAAGIAWWVTRQAPGTSVRVATVERAESRSESNTVLDASGYVTARLQATVSSKVTGKIVEVLVEEGMLIEQGQLLARLDDSLVRRQLALAEAELGASRQAVAESEVRLGEAELELERSRKLVDAEIRSQAALDTAQAEVDALRARIAVARDQVTVAERALSLRQQELEDTEIRAPFSGVAVTKNAQPGEMISPVSAGGGFTRTGVCTLVDMGSLEIEVDVNEAYINRVRDAMRVEAVLDAYPDWRIPASVITTVPTADRQKATVRVRIGFDTLDPRILPDMGVKVSFLEDPEPAAASEDPEVVPLPRVPAAAVLEDGERKIVFVVRGEAVERRAVGLGERRGDSYEVTSGLSGGEQVVVAGGEGLSDGDSVTVESP